MRPAHAFIFTTVVCLSVVAVLMVLVPAATYVIGGPCESEDSTWCHWDAQSSGNGQGRSFIAVGDHIIYIP